MDAAAAAAAALTAPSIVFPHSATVAIWRKNSSQLALGCLRQCRRSPPINMAGASWSLIGPDAGRR